MADIILTPIVELIIETLGSAAVQEIKSVYGARGELAKLESTLSTIRAVLVDAEKRQIREEQVKDWLEKLEAVLFDADDLVDGVGTEGLRRQMMPGKTVRKKVCTFFSSNNQLVFRHKIAREIRKIRERLAGIAADRRDLKLEVRQEETQYIIRARETGPFVVEEDVVGREKNKREILKRLLLEAESGSSTQRERVSVIPIVGMGGLGKTTLAQVIFNDEEVKKHFDLRIWVCVSDNFDNKLLIEKIVKSITDTNTESHNIQKLQEIVKEKLNGQRYLLVLDDVWNENPRKWQDLMGLLTTNCEERSRIIVTTRDVKVSDVMGTNPYFLELLDRRESWTLFEKLASLKGIVLTNPNTLDTARKIVAKCGGLPLAISMIGSTILCLKNPDIDWPFFLENNLSNITQEDGISSTLKLSYDYLPSHLKPCFAYCSLFPKDHEFNVRTLITLWVAQGFVKSSNQSNSLTVEDIGYKEYFEDLVSRSFFQEAKRDELNMVTSCKMHDLVHDLAIQVGEKECKMLASFEENVHKKLHHVSFDFPLRVDGVPSSLLQAKRLRSFLRHKGFLGKSLPQSFCNTIVSNFKFIRMLELHGMVGGRLPNSVGKLRHLRYLDLSHNYYLRRLPTSITKLVNLQTLKLNKCYDLRELPSKIEKLVNLRHLELNGCGKITHMPRGLSQLTNLQTLSLFVLSDNVPNSLEQLIGFNYLKGDELEIRGIRRGIETTVTKLGENEHLRSLHLIFNRRDDDASSNEWEWRTTLEGLKPHTNLRELTLENYGGTSLYSLLSPITKLVKLSLKDCSKCQQLPSLDQFHSLKEMRLIDLPALEYITIDKGDRFFSTSTSPTISVLPSLQKLTLRNLPNFRGWWRSDMAEENQVEQVIFPSFPRLSGLIIQCCPKLTSMPCYPNVEGALILKETSWKHFEETVLMRVPQARISATTTTKTELEASSSSSVASSYSSHPLSKLTYLELDNIVDLQYLPDDWMKGLTSVTTLRIWNCPGLKYLSLAIQYPTSLERLEIEICEELEEIKWPHTPALTNLCSLDLSNLPKLNISNLGQELQGSKDDSINETWQPLPSLRQLILEELPQLVTLPGGLQFLTRLESLYIGRCDNFTSLPDWISELSSLERLNIRDCPNFKSVPRSISNLTSLRRLKINKKSMNPREIREDLDLSCRIPGLKSWKIPKKFRVPWLCNK